MCECLIHNLTSAFNQIHAAVKMKCVRAFLCFFPKKREEENHKSIKERAINWYETKTTSVTRRRSESQKKRVKGAEGRAMKATGSH